MYYGVVKTNSKVEKEKFPKVRNHIQGGSNDKICWLPKTQTPTQNHWTGQFNSSYDKA